MPVSSNYKGFYSTDGKSFESLARFILDTFDLTGGEALVVRSQQDKGCTVTGCSFFRPHPLHRINGQQAPHGGLLFD